MKIPSRPWLCVPLLLVLGCAAAPQRPEWVAGTSTAYPDTRYLVGRGQGASPALARDRARADLAKNFRVAVSAETRDLLAYTSRSDGDGQISELASEVSRHIVTRTDQVIEGVKIVEQWQPEQGGENHALAVLDRLQAGNQLRRLIDDLDRDTELRLQRARSGDALLPKIGDATAALAAQVERRHYQDYLAVVDRTGVGVPPRHDPVRLKSDLDALLTRVAIRTRISADPLGGLEKALGGAIAAAGFVNADDASAGAYSLDAASVVEELAGKDGWYWVRGRVELTLREPDGSRVL
ncbi:MAG TPA: LPP20 family lipoprotein, partial [Deferrisomatales bacterium]|nr:LPP20 family lipoprotein [Deferrisomatales bacterium]